MLKTLRTLQLMLPGEPVAAALVPSGCLAIACVRSGDLLLAVFHAGTRGEEPRRSERLLRLGPIATDASPVQLVVPPDGSEEVIVIAGSYLMRVNLETMEPIWRFCLDADGGAVIAVEPCGMVIADPPARATFLDWDGEERDCLRLDCDVIGAATGPGGVVLALADCGIVRWRRSGGIVDRIADPSPAVRAGSAVVQVARDGRAYVLWNCGPGPRRLSVVDPAKFETIDVSEDCESLVAVSHGRAMMGSGRGIWILEGGALEQIGDFTSALRLCALRNGCVVAMADDNLIVVPMRGPAQMMAFPEARIWTSAEVGVWMIGASGYAVWLG